MSERLSETDVKKIAKLARLRLSDEEVALYGGQLTKILDAMAELARIDTQNVPPTTSVLGAVNVMREDEPRSFAGAAALLANAPYRDGPYFKVKKVIALALMLVALSARADHPDAKAKRTLTAAIRLYHRLELSEAKSRFDDALDVVPGWKTAAGFRAACRWTLGDGDGAAEDARLATKLKPNDAASYAARGKARLVLKDYDGALADFRGAALEDARSVEGPLGEGSTLFAQGKTREALTALNRAVNLGPDSAAALLMRGSVLDRLRDFRGASEDYRSLLAINPKFTWARLYRGKTLRELKDYRGAESDFSAFLETNGEYEDAYYLRSNVRFLLGDYRGAVVDLTKVIALNPRKGLAYSNRGQTRALLGDKGGAVSDLRKALELDPTRRDKISAAIETIEAKEAPEPEPLPRVDDTAITRGTISAFTRRLDAARDAPFFGEDGPAVTVEKAGSDLPPRRLKTPETDLDEPPVDHPETAEPGPARRRRDVPAERHIGEEKSLFIDR